MRKGKYQIVLENMSGEQICSMIPRRWLVPSSNFARAFCLMNREGKVTSVKSDDQYCNVFYLIMDNGHDYKVIFYEVKE